MSRLFLKKLIVVLTAVTVQCLALNASHPALAQDDAAVAVEVVEVDDAAEEEDDDDDEDAVAAVGALGNWGTTKAKVLGAKKFMLEQDFAVAVAEAIDLCELDERQLKKLKIASRGAIKKSFEKWKNKGMQQFGIGNFGNADDDEEEEVTPKVYTDADDIDMQTMQLASGMFNPFNKEIPTESKFWKKALKASLGEEQHQKLMKYRTERDQLKKEKNVAAAIETLAFEMRLPDETKQAFSKLLTPKMLEGDFSRVGPMYEIYVLYYYASKASKSKLKKILTKAQLQKWKSAIAPAKQIGQMFENQNAQNNAGDEEDSDWEETMSFLQDLDNAVDEVVEDVVNFMEGIVGK